MNVVRISDRLAIVPSMIVAVEREVWSDTRVLDVERARVSILTPFGQRVDVTGDVSRREAEGVYDRLLAAIKTVPE